jgi:hypothetical protein
MDIQKEKLRTKAKYTTAAKLKETTRANEVYLKLFTQNYEE